MVNVFLNRLYLHLPIYSRLSVLFGLVKRLIRAKKKVTIIDFGGGEAEVLRRIHAVFPKAPIKYYSVDLYVPKNPHPKIHHIKADLTKRIKATVKADLVISTHVIEHIPKKCVHNYIMNILQHAKDNAYLYVEAPSPETVKYPSFVYLKNGESPLNFYDDYGDERMPKHVKPYSSQEMFMLFVKHKDKETKLKKIKAGRNIALIPIILSPLIVPLAFIKRNRDIFCTFFWSITGWANYVLIKKKRI